MGAGMAAVRAGRLRFKFKSNSINRKKKASMDDVVIRFVFDKKKQATERRQGVLSIEARQLGTDRRVYISTGIKLYPNQFSPAGGFTCRNHPNAALLTSKAHNIFNKVEAFCLSPGCVSLEDVRGWTGKYETDMRVADFMRGQLALLNPSHATMEHTLALIRKIEDFGKMRTFRDVTIANIVEFDLYLKRSGVTAPATLNKRHSTFRRYIRKAVYKGLLDKDPYFEFNMPSAKSREPVFLTEEEIGKVMRYKPGTEGMERARDLFLFQCFTGLAYVDLMEFNEGFIQEVGGVEVIRSSRHKTGESYISVFLDEARGIAEKYGYRLPKMTNQKYNEHLKALSVEAGIGKNITTHSGRHTFATYLLNKGVPIETVSKAMGHSNIKMTQHYARLLGSKVVNDMLFLLKR